MLTYVVRIVTYARITVVLRTRDRAEADAVADALRTLWPWYNVDCVISTIRQD